MAEKIPKDPGALKITHQARGRTGMVYDLAADGHRLTISIFDRENARDPANFRVEGRATRADDAVVVSEWADTRTEALAAVGRAWDARAAADGLPAFDWAAVAAILDTVRAL